MRLTQLVAFARATGLPLVAYVILATSIGLVSGTVGRAEVAAQMLNRSKLVKEDASSVVPPAAGIGATVGNAADLIQAITTINGNAALNYTVTFSGSVGLTAATTLPIINTTATVVIDGKGFTLDGTGVQRGLFIYAGNITVQNLTIQNCVARGGNGAAGGGGGMGAGGAIFVNAGAQLTVSNLSLIANLASGGSGSDALGLGAGGGGGGGMGGNGGAGSGSITSGGGGGGGLGLGADGGAGDPVSAGGAGIAVGLGAGAPGLSPPVAVGVPGATVIAGGAGGINGGGGGGGGYGSFNGSGGGGGIGSGNGLPNPNGGFGGGGAGNGAVAPGFPGGFGGGGGGPSGNGGFGGGGGGTTGPFAGTAGFGGGKGGNHAGSGGGLGAGGGIFVGGGTLNVSGSFIWTGNAAGGGLAGQAQGGGSDSSQAANGQGLGNGVFLSSGAVLVLTTTAGQIETIADAIGDQNAQGSVTISGPGTIVLTAQNPCSSPVAVTSGMLVVNSPLTTPTQLGGIAQGPITVSSGATVAGTGDIGSDLILLPGAFVAPGAGVGTLTVDGNVTWNGSAEELCSISPSGGSSLLKIRGALIKGASGSYGINFQNAATAGTYTLASYGSTTFTSADVSYVNLPSGLAATFSFAATALQVTLVPTLPPTIAAATVNGVQGTAISYQVVTTNVPTSFSVQGSLPAGLTLNAATGLISGTPTASGMSTVMVTASNPYGSASAAITFNITGLPPVITSPLSVRGTGGVAFSYMIEASNTPSSYGCTGPLPDGMTFNPFNGTISGTTTAAGVFSVTISATNSIGTAAATLVITINVGAGQPIGRLPEPITSPTSATGRVGVAFTYQIVSSLSNGFSVSGALPPGLALGTSGTISGTPTQAGVFQVTLFANDGGYSARSSLTIVILPLAPLLTSASAASGTQGAPFSYSITASNAPTSYSLTGTLPAGLTFNSSAGTITGTPTASGSFTLTIGAANDGGSATQSLALTISSPPATVPTPAASGGGGGGGAPSTWFFATLAVITALRIGLGGRTRAAAPSA